MSVVSEDSKKVEIKTLVFLSLFAGLFSLGSWLSLPLGTSVVFTAQSMFVLWAGLMLGSRIATLSVLLWLILGAMGVPVFSRGSGGLFVLIGPTGGYLLGFLLMAFLAGAVRKLPINAHAKTWQKALQRTLYLLPAIFSVYLIAIPMLMWRTQRTLFEAILIGMLPYLATDILKGFLASWLDAVIRRP